MQTIKTIPIEIVEHIIDLLHDEPRALKSCALVCYQWLTRAQCNLFIGFNLDLGIAADLSESTLEDKIASLQRSSLPFFIIQSMKLTGGNVTSGMLSWHCWGQLQNLTELRLQKFDVLDTDLPPFLGRLLQLRFLGLDNVHFISPISVLSIIENTPQLSELKLLNIFWDFNHETDDEPGRVDRPSRPVPLHHITLDGIENLDTLIEILLEAQPNLALWSLWTQRLDTDYTLMDKCCASLRTLDLRLHNAASFDMTAYESLCTLVIPEASYGTICPEFFEFVTSKSFKNLVLCLEAPQWLHIVKENGETFNWACIDRGMSDFHPSASVLIASKYLDAEGLGGWESHFRKGIAEFLPLCAQRGVLRVYPCDAQIWRDLHVNMYTECLSLR